MSTNGSRRSSLDIRLDRSDGDVEGVGDERLIGNCSWEDDFVRDLSRELVGLVLR